MYWIDEFIEEYSNFIEIIIVIGKNKKLYDNLIYKKFLKNIKVFGFVNDMYNLIRECDLMLIKFGGVIIFEVI